MAELISIIIPAYNAAKYLESCLLSICSQTYGDWEIIVSYDEKCTDDTLDILNEYANIWNIIIDVGQDRGSGDARNRGLSLATGEFVVFVDADDVLHPRYLELLMDCFKKYPNISVASCNYRCINDNEYSVCGSNFSKCSDKHSKIQIYDSKRALYLKLWNKLPPMPWVYLIRRELLIENHISFPQYTFGDDEVFTWEVINSSDYVAQIDKELYLYIQHEGSVVSSLPALWWDQYLPARTDILSYFNEKNSQFAVDVQSSHNRHLAYAYASRLPYVEFKSEMTKYGVSRLNFFRQDHFSGYLATICYNLSKRLYWEVVHKVLS